MEGVGGRELEERDIAERERERALGFWVRADLRESRGIRERPC